MNKLSHLLYESCHYVQKDLTQRYNYNIEYSGTTLCSAFLLGKILYVSNIGNSRIILGNYNSNLNKWNSRQLSFEHTPTSPDEIKRIMAINSKVTIARNENELLAEINLSPFAYMVIKDMNQLLNLVDLKLFLHQ